MRGIRMKHLVPVAVVVACLAIGASGPPETKPPITLYEWAAKTLVTLIVRTLRNPFFNQSVFFTFRVGVVCDSPSNLVNRFAVNRYTRDVLERYRREPPVAGNE